MEFVGTFLLTFTAATNTAGPLGVAFVLMGIVFMAGHISLAQFNPAISICFMLRGRMPIKDTLLYICVQCAAAICGGMMGHFVTDVVPVLPPYFPLLSDKLNQFSIEKVFLCEVMWTFLLAYLTLNIATTAANANNCFYGLAIGTMVGAGVSSIGPISGNILNPAVGTGLLVTALMNHGSAKFLWLYWAAPIVGSVLAFLTFRLGQCSEYELEREKERMSADARHYEDLQL